MGLLTKEGLLKKQELKIEQVDLGNDEYVFVKEMTGMERDRFEQSIYILGEDGKVQTTIDNFRAKLAVVTVCDDKGDLLLEPDDYTRLARNMGAARLELIIEAAQKLNKISKKDREELSKNLKADRKGGSSSSSAKL